MSDNQIFTAYESEMMRDYFLAEQDDNLLLPAMTGATSDGCGLSTNNYANMWQLSENSPRTHQSREEDWSSYTLVQKLPNPVYQDGRLAVDEPLDRKREYWSHNFIEMLRQENILPRGMQVEVEPNTPVQPFCLSQRVLRLIEQEPEVYQLSSFPKGVPGGEDTTYRVNERPLSSSFNDDSPHPNFTFAYSQRGSDSSFERGAHEGRTPSSLQDMLHSEISVDQYDHCDYHFDQ